MNQPDLQTCMEEKIKTVYRIAFHYFGNVEEAEDVTQEVFLKFYSSDIGEKNEEEIKAWLIRVTMNTCHSHYRNPFNRKRSDVSESEMENISVIGSSEQEYVERRIVMDAVLALPERYRAIVYLYYYEEYSIGQISKILKIKETTIQTRLSRARGKLKTVLADCFPEERSSL